MHQLSLFPISHRPGFGDKAVRTQLTGPEATALLAVSPGSLAPNSIADLEPDRSARFR